MENSFLPAGVTIVKENLECYLQKKSGIAKGSETFFRVDFTGGWYLGVEYAIEDDWTLTWYYMPTGDCEAMLFLYLGDSEPFDRFISLFEKPETNDIGMIRDDDFIKKMQSFFPTLMETIFNTQRNEFQNPALLKLIGPNSKCACLGMEMKPFNFFLPHYWVSETAASKVLQLKSYAEGIVDELSRHGINSIDALASFARKYKSNELSGLQRRGLKKIIEHLLDNFFA